MSEEQSVAKPDDEAKPSSETQGAQDDYEALLAEYTKDTSVETKPEPASKDDDTAELLQWARQQRQIEAKNQFNQELNTAVKAVKELSEVDLSDRVVKGYLNAIADEDERVKKAWENRSENPEGWKAALKKVAAEIKKETQKVDAGVTEDREAMTAAVRGVRTETKEDAAPDVQKMSSRDFNKHLRELGIG